MRLLFARVGRTLCRNCGKEVLRETAEVVARQLGELPAGTRLLLGFDIPVVEAGTAVETREVDELAEIVEDESADSRETSSARDSAANGAPDAAAVTATIEVLRRKGFARLLVDGRAVPFDEVNVASLPDRSLLKVVVDRVQLGDDDQRQRLTDSIETSYLEGGGAAWAVELPQSTSAGAKVHRFSERFECRNCGIAYEDPQPRLFSFNNPFGACPTCHADDHPMI